MQKNAYYVAFWVDFHFLQGQASFWQADLFCHEKHRIVIVFVHLHFVFVCCPSYGGVRLIESLVIEE